MAEVQRYESMVPMRYVVLQGKGHGPVLVRSPGLTTATCLQCEWHGFDRGALPSSDGLIEADGELHLQDVEDAEMSPGRLVEALDEAYGRGRDDEANGVPTERLSE